MDENTKSVRLKTQGGGVEVDREQILAALTEFDRKFRSSEDDSGTRYTIEEGGRRYPPKRILELATGISRNKFHGGKPSNDVFIRLGFNIKESNGNQSGKARLNEPIPSADRLVDDLFAKTWIPLHDDSVELSDSQYPGVYVLAYDNQDLAGAPVIEDKIYYVGVSHAGVRKCLRQFKGALEDGHHHSAGGRFFKEVAKGTRYSLFAQRKPFCVASISIPCTVLKVHRLATDLRKMGIVAQLEWYVLARVREKTNKEPFLNKK
jgi:hypothetical protein